MPVSLRNLRVNLNEYVVEVRRDLVKNRNKSAYQKINSNGRVEVPIGGWIIRSLTLCVILGISSYNIYESIRTNDPFALFSFVILMHTACILLAAWLLYRNPGHRSSEHTEKNAKATVIIPVYNQEKMIEDVIDAVYDSSYENLEVVVVNDGSTDGTARVLDQLASSGKYSSLRVIHKENGGKRRAVAKGFFETDSEYVVLIDSDSVIDPNAIEELAKAFESDLRVGALVGCARVWNAEKNFITRCQDSWYDYAFNIYKSAESVFNSVTCCSGCLAAYRREAIKDFIKNWSESAIQYSDDRMLTNEVLRSKLLKSASQFDDSEDRILTSQSMAAKWKSLYVASAIVYTDVPETMRQYLKQQQRWKKGYIRSNAFASTFFWKNRNPLMSFIFYADYLMTFTLPAVIILNFTYAPLVLQTWNTTLMFLAGILGLGITHGIDYKMRVRETTTWKYKFLMVFMTTFLNSWLMVPALLTLRKNSWGTR